MERNEQGHSKPPQQRYQELPPFPMWVSLAVGTAGYIAIFLYYYYFQ